MNSFLYRVLPILVIFDHLRMIALENREQKKYDKKSVHD